MVMKGSEKLKVKHTVRQNTIFGSTFYFGHELEYVGDNYLLQQNESNDFEGVWLRLGIRRFLENDIRKFVSKWSEVAKIDWLRDLLNLGGSAKENFD